MRRLGLAVAALVLILMAALTLPRTASAWTLSVGPRVSEVTRAVQAITPPALTATAVAAIQIENAGGLRVLSTHDVTPLRERSAITDTLASSARDLWRPPYDAVGRVSALATDGISDLRSTNTGASGVLNLRL